MSDHLILDPGLSRKYRGDERSYATYPSPDSFVEPFDTAAYRTWLASRKVGGVARPCAVHMQLPLCSGDLAAQHLHYLEQEIRLVTGLMGEERRVRQLYWSGASPQLLGDQALMRLMNTLHATFELEPSAENTIELNVSDLAPEQTALLRELGFNCINLGIQVLSAEARRATSDIDRVKKVYRILAAARKSGFTSVRLDLVYGLPGQDIAGLRQMLGEVVRYNPDRVALFASGPAHWLSERPDEVPRGPLGFADRRLQVLYTAMVWLEAAGYVYVGAGSFVKVHDDLVLAQRSGRLCYDTRGYSTHGECDVVGLGISAISKLGPIYSQNAGTLAEYHNLLDAGSLPVQRGMVLTSDDLARRSVIQALICHCEVSIEAISIAYLIDFNRHFAAELTTLKEFARDRLMEIDDEWITVTSRGKLYLPAICQVFDRYV